MRWICLIFAVISFTSFMNDLDMLNFPSIRIIPSIGNNSPTFLTLLFFLATLGLLGRMLKMAVKREKEKLRKQIKDLNNKVEELKNKNV